MEVVCCFLKFYFYFTLRCFTFSHVLFNYVHNWSLKTSRKYSNVEIQINENESVYSLQDTLHHISKLYPSKVLM